MVVAGDDDQEAAPFGQPLYNESHAAEAAPFGQPLYNESDHAEAAPFGQPHQQLDRPSIMVMVLIMTRMVMLHHRHTQLFRAVPSAEATCGRSGEALIILLRRLLNRLAANILPLPRRD